MPETLARKLAAIRHVDVLLEGTRVGTLAAMRSGLVAFEYAPEWLASGFSISPFSLPLRPGLFETPEDAPDGLFGIFRDSLPDDWGRLLQDRKLAELGVRLGSLSVLARLSLVGATGLGSLEYVPYQKVGGSALTDDWDLLYKQCRALLDGRESESLDGIYALGSSSGGARPKVMVELDGAPWIVKFPSRFDAPDSGLREYKLAQLAMACGILMPEVRLISSQTCGGYFATKRFDRASDDRGPVRKVHMASAAALLEALPFDVLDYRDLMQLTLELTGNVADCEQLFRVMCFNVAVGNCDDHARNFTYLYENGAWRLSPAYDLTQDEGFLGEHATLVNGKGATIGEDDLLTVGAAGAISIRKGREIMRQIARVTAVVSKE
ncbi:MAG: type II toxin-antitoxin system HipA family toxin [Atopobiaceae bacterium]|nr:type II toxin-antitoxin system HipA family toxin [Atopobiaceae bacterium]